MPHQLRTQAPASPPPLAAELGFTRVRPHMNWPKSDKSDFGWRDREGAWNDTYRECALAPSPQPSPASGGGSRPSLRHAQGATATYSTRSANSARHERRNALRLLRPTLIPRERRQWGASHGRGMGALLACAHAELSSRIYPRRMLVFHGESPRSSKYSADQGNHCAT